MIHKLANVWGIGIIPENTKVAAFCDIGNPQIGENCNIQTGVSIPPGWKIGNRVFIGPGVRFSNDKHPQIGREFIPEEGIVEDDVVIGIGSIILPCRIGKGSFIGAGSLVLHDVSEGILVYGSPAKVMGTP